MSIVFCISPVVSLPQTVIPNLSEAYVLELSICRTCCQPVLSGHSNGFLIWYGITFQPVFEIISGNKDVFVLRILRGN